MPRPEAGIFGSRIGFGCYRVDDASPDHRAALLLALESGCRVIDTSTNYTDGASERLVGSVLRELGQAAPALRGIVTLVSKIGYVQGENLRLATERERAGRPFPEMVKYTDDCWHCIHPEFLRDQLTRSRERLRIETLDVCLLHNPEYFLSVATKGKRRDLGAARTEFYRRLREAFGFLEEAVGAGEIRAYGVSSNSAVSPPGDPEATSVSRMVAAAEEAGGSSHHFRVLQMPMNLFESGGALVRNTGPDEGETALQAATAAGLEVLVNRPLNAFLGGRLIRLADPEAMPSDEGAAEPMARIEALEKEYRAGIGRNLEGAPLAASDQLFELVEQLTAIPDQIVDALHWQQIEQQYVIPRINMMIGGLARVVPAELHAPWEAWWQRYLPALQGLLREIGRTAALKGRAQVEAIAGAIEPALPAERHAEPLSRKAVWVLASTPGVSCVLVGMRRPAYVRDLLPVADWPALDDPLAVYQRLAEAGERAADAS